MDINIREAQSETILGMVNDILATGEFAAPPEEPVAENEESFGEMTPYEKAIYSAKIMVADKTIAMIEGVAKNEIDKNQVLLNKSMCDALEGLLWTSIQYRLGKESLDSYGIGVRADWKIVSINKNAGKNTFDEVGELLKVLFSGAAADEDFDDGFMSRLGEKCAGCGYYDRCDVPFKQKLPEKEVVN